MKAPERGNPALNQRVAPRPDNAIKRLARKITGTGPRWQQVLRWTGALSATGLVVGVITFFLLYQLISIPDPNADFRTQTTNVYYSDGKHKIGTFATQDRDVITLDKVPKEMQAAVIAAEDRTFYSNRGIDIKGIIRAARNNATSGQITGGGSTITQQYVKILYLSQEQSYTRKIREAILSIKIHNKLSKQEILEGYLNTIYFGNGAYGIEVASQTYFDKPASELDYTESAALAAILNQPSYYDPYVEGGQTAHGAALQLRDRRHGEVRRHHGHAAGRGPEQAPEVREEEGQQPLQGARTATCCDWCRRRCSSWSSPTPTSSAAASTSPPRSATRSSRPRSRRSTRSGPRARSSCTRRSSRSSRAPVPSRRCTAARTTSRARSTGRRSARSRARRSRRSRSWRRSRTASASRPG